jgi:hypothetical protein
MLVLVDDLYCTYNHFIYIIPKYDILDLVRGYM